MKCRTDRPIGKRGYPFRWVVHGQLSNHVLPIRRIANREGNAFQRIGQSILPRIEMIEQRSMTGHVHLGELAAICDENDFVRHAIRGALSLDRFHYIHSLGHLSEHDVFTI